MAVGYHDGAVRLFKLSQKLSNLNQDDHKVLKSLLEEKMEKLAES